MFDVASIQGSAGSPAFLAGKVAYDPPAHREHGAGRADDDRVELSDSVPRSDSDDEFSPAMLCRIREIKARIADGTYLTEHKIDVAVERLFEELSKH